MQNRCATDVETEGWNPSTPSTFLSELLEIFEKIENSFRFFIPRSREELHTYSEMFSLQKLPIL